MLIERWVVDLKLLNRDNPYHYKTNDYKYYYSKVKRSFLASLFHYKCQRCGFKNDTRMFHFHHRNPKDKLFDIGGRFGMKDKVALFEELLKCDYLCENCHYEVHAEMGDIDEEFKAISGRRYTIVQNMLGSSD